MRQRLLRAIASSTLAAFMAVPAFASERGASLLAQPVTATTSTVAAASATQPGTNQPPTQVIPPAKMNLPPELTEIVRLTESGINQDVIVSYVRNSPTSYAVSADQIVYLRDLGVSNAIIQALVEHGASAATEATAPVAASSATTAETQAPTQSNGVTDTNAPPPVSGAAASFYDSLSPYGTWLDVPGYGWCWQPTVAVANPTWEPYCDNGYWLWSDDGWYWDSYYSWGWAPFHYGRWWRYPQYGWLWCPDRVWGPAWVCWRDWGDYCGWAPLPPGAYFTAGLGWTFGGVGVGIGFGFGLPWSYYSFVPYRHFCDRDWHEHRLGGHEARGVFDRSHVNNRYLAESGHRFINRGVDPARVEAATHTHLRSVAVRDLSRTGNRAMMPGRVERTGRSMTVYRPGSNLSVPRNPALGSLNRPRTFARSAGSWMTHRAANVRGENPHGTSRTQSANSANRLEQRMPTTRNSSRSRPEAGHYSTASPPRGRNETFRGHNSTPSVRSMPSPNVPRNYSSHSSPRWTFTRPSYSRPSFSYRSAPSWSAPHTSISRPSYSWRSYSSPSFSSRASPNFGGGHSSSFSRGGYGNWGGHGGYGGHGFGRR